MDETKNAPREGEGLAWARWRRTGARPGDGMVARRRHLTCMARRRRWVRVAFVFCCVLGERRRRVGAAVWDQGRADALGETLQ
jgi:hypothetical protein